VAEPPKEGITTDVEIGEESANQRQLGWFEGALIGRRVGFNRQRKPDAAERVVEVDGLGKQHEGSRLGPRSEP
jgi:hypothetical protein